MKTKTYLAVDLGAESGRIMAGAFDGACLSLREIHRFRNTPVFVRRHLHWDVLRIFDDIVTGVRRALRSCDSVASLGLDTWGVDFALLDKTGALLGNPHHYRDRRTDGIMEKTFERVSRREIFEETGVQFMQINTLYQLASMVLNNDPALTVAETLLLMPDLFNYWLTGEKVSEYTIATTTQFFDPRKAGWARGVIDKTGLPGHILPPVIRPATVINTLSPEALGSAPAGAIKVIAPACHDTESAIAAISARADEFAYISSGTWSLMGVVTRSPVITPQALEFGFTNEGGVDGTFCLLKNLTGLWIVQECRKEWSEKSQAGELDYDAMTSLAEKAQPGRAFIDPDHRSFLNPPSMTGAIRDYCLSTGQAAPDDPGAVVRIALESLACKYRQTLEQLETLTGRRIAVVHIVGGGARNRLLSQLTADACARPVYAGPVEATALGNICAQLVALGDCASWQEARDAVNAAQQPELFSPSRAPAWEDAYRRFAQISGRFSA